MIKVKLALDQNAFPKPSDRLLYVASRLSGDAYTRIRNQISNIADSPNADQWPSHWRDYTDLLEYLDPVYIIVDVAVQAQSRFETLFQGQNMDFADFISTFNKLANKCKFDNTAKVRFLHQKVNAALQDRLASVVNPPANDDFEA